MSGALSANQFGYEGFNVGVVGVPGVDLGMIAGPDGGLVGLNSPARTTQLADRQGHGKVPGSQWANERSIEATLWTSSIDTVLAFDAAMAPRPDPLDEVPWVGNFLGLGLRRCYVRPESCVWALTQLQSVGFWKIDAKWTAAEPTIFSEDEPLEVIGSGSSTDVGITNAGLSTSLSGRAYTVSITAAGGTAHDPFFESLDNPDQSIRFTGLDLTDGHTVNVDAARTCMVGELHVEGLIRSRGSRYPNWPLLAPGVNNWRFGTAGGGNVTAHVRHRHTWSV